MGRTRSPRPHHRRRAIVVAYIIYILHFPKLFRHAGACYTVEVRVFARMCTRHIYTTHLYTHISQRDNRVQNYTQSDNFNILWTNIISHSKEMRSIMRFLCKLQLLRWSMLVAPLFYLVFVLFILNLTFPLSSLTGRRTAGASALRSAAKNRGDVENRSSNAADDGMHANDVAVAYNVEPKQHSYEELRTLKESFYKWVLWCVLAFVRGDTLPPPPVQSCIDSLHTPVWCEPLSACWLQRASIKASDWGRLRWTDKSQATCPDKSCKTPVGWSVAVVQSLCCCYSMPSRLTVPATLCTVQIKKIAPIVSDVRHVLRGYSPADPLVRTHKRVIRVSRPICQNVSRLQPVRPTSCSVANRTYVNGQAWLRNKYK